MNVKELKVILEAMPDDMPVFTSYDHCCYGEIDIEQLAIVDHERDGNLVFTIAAHNHYRDEISDDPKEDDDKAGIMITDLLGKLVYRVTGPYIEGKGKRSLFDVTRCLTDWHNAVEYGKRERDKELAKEELEKI